MNLTIEVESCDYRENKPPRARGNNLGPISESDRAGAAAEAALRQRDREEGRRVRGMRRLLYDESDGSDEEGIFLGYNYFYDYIIL